MSYLSVLAMAAIAIPALSQTVSNETVLGVYMFHRHGDRTAKAWPPTNLTALGYEEVYNSGTYYRSRYIASNADFKVNGISSDLVNLAQISASAPNDNVLMNSAQGFLQGLYPPAGNASYNVLRDNQTVQPPLGGYQLIPVALVTGGSGQENGVWLQATTGCTAAAASSNNYLLSTSYQQLLNSSASLYKSILPVVNGTFDSSSDSFKNAYAIWDLINVAEIHNRTINSSNLITDDVFNQLSSLAQAHEWGLAYNSSDTIRAISGMSLAGQIVDALNNTIATAGKQKFNVQFGAYGTFSSFFGLAGLQNVNPAFYGIVDYASAMTFEMFTNTSTPVSKTSYPTVDEIYVRFLFHNGSTNSSSPPTNYPLFGQDVLSWNDFQNGMSKFAINSTEQWCNKCQNFTGACAAYAPSGSSGASTNSDSSHNGGNGLSPAVNGVIGAMVTLAVILGLEGLILLIGGFRIVNRKRLAPAGSATNAGKA